LNIQKNIERNSNEALKIDQEFEYIFIDDPSAYSGNSYTAWKNNEAVIYSLDLRTNGSQSGNYVRDTPSDTTISSEGNLFPSIQIITSIATFSDILYGRLNPMWAFMTQKIRINGSMGVGATLAAVLALPQDNPAPEGDILMATDINQQFYQNPKIRSMIDAAASAFIAADSPDLESDLQSDLELDSYSSENTSNGDTL
jgi:putative sterol carrier protein